jgi:hypothetical protein
MKTRRHTPEQIIRKLAEGDKLLAQDKTTSSACPSPPPARCTTTPWATRHEHHPGVAFIGLFKTELPRNPRRPGGPWRTMEKSRRSRDRQVRMGVMARRGASPLGARRPDTGRG